MGLGGGGAAACGGGGGGGGSPQPDAMLTISVTTARPDLDQSRCFASFIIIPTTIPLDGTFTTTCWTE